MRIGYACLNQTLSATKITVNRGMVRKTFDAKGLTYAGELASKNLEDLLKIIQWNYEHDIHFYRMSSNMFPWMSEYHLEDLPQYKNIRLLLQEAGELAGQLNQRLTFHPGPFNVLASGNEEVVKKTIIELDQHAAIMDMMELSQTTFNKINIHVGTTLQGNKKEAMKNFCKNFPRLSEAAQSRITVENDDKANMYTIEDLYYHIYSQIKTPLVFDFHHHLCHPGHQSQEEALNLALETWPENIPPVVHYSEPKSLMEKKLIRAHADYIERQIPTYEKEFDIMIEAKMKECAIFQYRSLEEAASLQPSLKEIVAFEN